jgi:hypothetical protein
MGWETRGGQRYYYRKVRIGGKVVSEYVGAGEVAEACFNLDGIDRTRAIFERNANQAQRDKAEALDKQVDEALDLARTVADGMLLLAGFHMHKRQWRRMRKGNNATTKSNREKS